MWELGSWIVWSWLLSVCDFLPPFFPEKATTEGASRNPQFSQQPQEALSLQRKKTQSKSLKVCLNEENLELIHVFF